MNELEPLRDSLRKFGASSRTLAGVQRVRESVRRSTVRRTVSGVSSGSGTTAAFGGYAGEWFTSSTVARVTATVTGAASTVETWVVDSYLYRWLTKEPDPDVIVIDLRETYTVGPFLRGVDRVAPAVATAVRGSLAWSIAERASERVVEPAAESRTVQFLAAALAPPEPPEAVGREPNGRERSGADSGGEERSGADSGGEKSDGVAESNEKPNGKTSDEETTDQETPDGEFSGDEMADGET